MALTAAKPKKNPLHKKRQAGHHRQSKHYLKAYWPYLPVALIVAGGLMLNNIWSHSKVLGAQSDFSSQTLLESTNIWRSSKHETPLALNAQLSAAAQAKASDMAQQNYWSHTSPTGSTPWTFITSAGYQYEEAGENLAYGFSNATDVVTGWMNSQEHRANILNADYQDVGFGVASAPNYLGKGAQTIVVAEYAHPVAAAANISFTVPQTADNAPAVKAAQTELKATPVARVQLLTGGQAAWSMAAVSALAGAAAMLFVLRHGFRIQRAVSRGEAFVAHHPWFDIGIAFVATAGFLLTRTGGLIR